MSIDVTLANKKKRTELHMTKKKKSDNEVVVSFGDSSSVEQVTGSSVQVNDNILIEFGGSQGQNVLKNYKDNNKNFSFSVKKLEYVFVCHQHQDHEMKVPLIFARGGRPKVFVPSGSREIMYKSLSNCAMILEGEAKTLTVRSKNGQVFSPLYTQDDVDLCMENVYEVDMHLEKTLNEDTTFKFISSGHIPFGASLILNIKGKTIYYTSDLGNEMFESYYCEPMEVPKSADLVIAETTYCSAKKSNKKTDEREKDMERIASAVDQYKKILIPCFSQYRAQLMATILYEMYFNDPTFDHIIVMDSILLNDITDIYKKKFEHFRKVMSWDKIKQIDKKSRDAYKNSDEKVIVISASGSLVGGASIAYAQAFLPRRDSCCLIVGFTFEGSLARKIKDGELKKIKIGDEEYSNNMQVTCLRSMSSHIQHNPLKKLLVNIATPKIALHHGNSADKQIFKKELKDHFEKVCKTTKVVCPTRKTKIKL